MQKDCIILEIRLLKHLKTDFFHIMMDFNKKSQMWSIKKQPNWVRVDEKKFNQMKDQVKKVKDSNLYVRPNRDAYTNINDSHELIRDIQSMVKLIMKKD